MKSAATIDWLTFTLKMVIDPVVVIKDFLALDPDLFNRKILVNSDTVKVCILQAFLFTTIRQKVVRWKWVFVYL